MKPRTVTREMFFRRLMELPSPILVATLRDAAILTGTQFTHDNEVEFLDILKDPAEKAAYARMITDAMVEEGLVS